MKNRVLFGLIALLTFTSCKKMLDIDSTRTVGEKNMWNSLEDTRAALMGVYGLTQAALADHNSYWLYGDVRAGDFSSPTRQDLKAIINNDLNAAYPSLMAMSNWRRWYAVINSANIFLERAGEVREKDSRYTENNMTVDIAQARFLRAFAYFYMVRIWGDVPFITSSYDGQFVNKEREDQGRILAWVEQEMLVAANDLPYRYSAGDEQQQGDYYNESSGRWDGALARKLSAYAVLAHVAAWQSDYPNVASYTKFVTDNYERAGMGYISTGHLTDANGFFFNKKTNQLFGFNFDWGHIAAGFTGHIEELTLAEPVVNKSIPDIYLPKDSILRIFNERGDERFSLDTLGNPSTERYFTNFNGKYPIFSKIKAIMGGTASDPTFRIFSSAIVFTRLEDVTLLRAEALAVLGERNAAIQNLNEIRARRNLNDYSEELNGELLNAIFHERQRELMGEGHRWYDLVRYNKIRGSAAFKKLIEEGGIYWPISRDVITQNNAITQNSYWQ